MIVVYGVGIAVLVVADGADDDVLAEADHERVGIVRALGDKLDARDGNGDLDRALRGHAVEGGGGDERLAVGHAGDHAVFIDGGNLGILALPGKVGGREGTGVGGHDGRPQLQRLVRKHARGLGKLKALNGHDDVDGAGAGHAGAVAGDACERHPADLAAGERAGAVPVVHAGDAVVGHAPVEVLVVDEIGIAVLVVGGGADGDVLAEADHERAGLARILGGELYARRGNGDLHGAGGLQVVVGGGGDDRLAVVYAGDHAVLDGGHALVGAGPVKVLRVFQRGVGGRAVGPEGDRLPGEHAGVLRQREAGDGHDHAHEYGAGDTGAVAGDAGEGDVAGAPAHDVAGAVPVVFAGDAVVGNAPVEVLVVDVLDASVLVVGGGADHERLADLHDELLGVIHAVGGELYARRGNGYLHGAGGLQVVVRGGGDDRRAVAQAGDHAVLDGGHALVGAGPVKVLRVFQRGVGGRAAGLERHILADEHAGVLRQRKAGDGHDHAHEYGAAHAGAVLGIGVDRGRAGGNAVDRAGAVAVVPHAHAVGVAAFPVKALEYVGGGVVRAERRGAQHKVAGVDVDVRGVLANGGDVHLHGGRGHADQALILQAVVRNRGDDRRAVAHAGDDAFFVHGGDAFIVACPGKVRGVFERGVDGRAAGLERHGLADEHALALGQREAGHGYDYPHRARPGLAGAVAGDRGKGERARPIAGERAGAVLVVYAGHAVVGRVPVEETVECVLALAIFVIGGGADGDALAHAHHERIGLRAHGGQLDVIGRRAHIHGAAPGGAVMCGGGDDGRAVTHAGEHAVFNGDDALVAALPGEVLGRTIGGVGGRHTGPQRGLIADEEHHAFGDAEAADGHDHAHRELSVHGGIALGVGIDVHGAGAYALDGAGAVAVVVHLGAALVGGAPDEGLLHALAVAARIDAHGAQCKVARADGHIGVGAVQGLDDDARRQVVDRHKVRIPAAVERLRDQAHLARAHAGELAVRVHGGRAGDGLNRPDHIVGLRSNGIHGGAELRLSAHAGDARLLRDRHGGGKLMDIHLYAHRRQALDRRGDGDHAGRAARAHQRAARGLRLGDGGDALVARGPGDVSVEYILRPELEAERLARVQEQNILRGHFLAAVVQRGMRDARVERHLRGEQRARADVAALGAQGLNIFIGKALAACEPPLAGVVARQHPAVEGLALRGLGHGQLHLSVRRERGHCAAGKQLVKAAVEGDDDARLALGEVLRGRVQGGQLHARLAHRG